MPTRRFTLALLAYAIPTFTIAYLWHLVVFAHIYDALQIYREDLIVPFGALTILIQGGLFAAAYPRLFAGRSVLSGGLRFAITGGLLSWTFTTLATAAKFPMTSVAQFLGIETAFTVVQWLVVGPLMAWTLRDVPSVATER